MRLAVKLVFALKSNAFAVLWVSSFFCDAAVESAIQRKILATMYTASLLIAILRQEAFEKCWAHSPQRAASRQFTRCRHCTVARSPRIDVHNDDNDNAWQRGPLWPHGMGPIMHRAEWANSMESTLHRALSQRTEDAKLYVIQQPLGMVTNRRQRIGINL